MSRTNPLFRELEKGLFRCYHKKHQKLPIELEKVQCSVHLSDRPDVGLIRTGACQNSPSALSVTNLSLDLLWVFLFALLSISFGGGGWFPETNGIAVNVLLNVGIHLLPFFLINYTNPTLHSTNNLTLIRRSYSITIRYQTFSDPLVV